MDYTIIEEICGKYNIKYKKDEPLASYTSFKIGGCCPVMIYPDSVDCLKALTAEFFSAKILFRVLGKGSNLLISDKGVSFPVISLALMNKAAVDGERILCGAGASLAAICRLAEENGLSGLEFAYGIPGSVGGAVYMNAGAYGGEMKDVLSECTYIDGEGRLVPIANEDMELSYRHSFFSEKNYVIAEIELKLKKGDRKDIRGKMDDFMSRRKEKQPLEYPSAGSTFKRPRGNFAGKLIEEAGLKGFSVGGAQVSEKHCGFIVNKGGASFDDVKNIIEEVKDRVRESSGVVLENEVLIWE